MIEMAAGDTTVGSTLTCEKNPDRPISFNEKNKTPKGGSAARDDDRIDVFLV